MLSRLLLVALVSCVLGFRTKPHKNVLKGRGQFRKVVRTGRIRIAGHRGASYTAPENTLQSNAVAFEQGADGTEFDVFRSADGEVFLLHDYTLYKLGSKTCPPTLCFEGGLTEAEYLEKLNTPVTGLSYWDFIRHVDIGSWKGPEWAGITPPLLKDAMAAIPDGKFALVELKGGAQDLVEAAVSIAEENGLVDKMHFISFNLTAMAYAKQLLVERGMLNMAWFIKGTTTTEACFEDVRAAHAAHMDGIDWYANPYVVTPEVIAEANRNGMEVAVWVSSKYPESDVPENAAYLESTGVDIFTSDLPPAMQKYIRTRG